MSVYAGRMQLRSLVGKTICGQYRVDKLLGEGGMGSVFAGVQLSLDRPVAIKVMQPEVAKSEDARKRFSREARLTARLNHPNTIKLFEFGETEDGMVFLVMELLDGQELADIIEKDGALAPLRAVNIAAQVAKALRAGHKLGIVHRDLKPGNVRITHDDDEQERAIVLDFGFAKKIDESVSQRVTSSGTILGTPAYMSPEQAQGKPVDTQSDVYSLGIILFEMLTGRVPFASKSMISVLMMQTSQQPPPVADLRPELGQIDGLQPLLDAMLDKKAANRPDPMATATRLRALSAQLQGTAAPAEPAAAVRVDDIGTQEATVFFSAMDDDEPDGRPPGQSVVEVMDFAATATATESESVAAMRAQATAPSTHRPTKQAQTRRAPRGRVDLPISPVGTAADLAPEPPEKAGKGGKIAIGLAVLALVGAGLGFSLLPPKADKAAAQGKKAVSHLGAGAATTGDAVDDKGNDKGEGMASGVQPSPDEPGGGRPENGDPAPGAAEPAAEQPAPAEAAAGQQDSAKPAAKPAAADSETTATSAPKNAETALQAGQIHVASTPDGASVFVNRKRIGTTPMVVDVPKHGRVRLALRKKGFRPFRVRFAHDEAKNVAVTLQSRSKKR